MKRISRFLFSKVLIVALLFGMVGHPVFAQRKDNKPQNSISNIGGSYHSKSTNKRARKGGRNTLPIGIEGKKINIGLGSGLAIPSLSLKTEEHVTLGSNSHLYAHFLINGRSTYGLGFNTNLIYLGSDVTKFYNENENLTFASASPWTLFTISPSFLFNFTIQQRISAQFIINPGALMCMVPQNRLNFIDSVSSIGEPTIAIKRDYRYQTGMTTGWFVSGIFQFNYALTRNLEARVGMDYFYGRFNYQRINITDPLVPLKESTLRELKLIDLFAGISISF
jgi:hypothetical protein